MSLQERLHILQQELTRQLEYRDAVQKTGSTIDYSAEDFERESMLMQKIVETKEWIMARSVVLPTAHTL